MKKILFFASVLALATSCTQDEYLSLDVQNEKTGGIVFEAVESVDSRIQYDKESNGWSPFWYAEEDRVTIFANGVIKGSTPATAAGSWFTLGSTYAQYKATSSTKKANFTSVDDNNLLKFIPGSTKESKFLAVYNPSGMSSVSVAAETASAPDKVDTLFVSGILPTSNTQTVKTVKGQNDAIAMIATATATQDEVYESVGEKVGLKFNYVTPIMKFGTKGLNSDYQKAFGNLKQIVVGTHGKGNAMKPSPLAFSSSAMVAIDTVNFNPNVVDNNYTAADSASFDTLTVTIGSAAGLAWNDNAIAPVAIAPSNRSKTGEKITATFKFDKIDIEVVKDSVPYDFVKGNDFWAITLNMADYPYLVTNSYPRTLFVNSGDFSDIKHMTGTTADGVKWNGQKVAFTDFNTVVVAEGVVLDAEDFKLLNQMTNVKYLTLNGNTSIPAKAINELANLTTINMPKVTTVAVDAFKGDVRLDTIVMPAYTFREAVNDSILNKNTLKYINMGATALNAGFPKTGLKFDGFTALKEVKVIDGIDLGPNAFDGCTSLVKVNGVVNVIGTDVFKGCSALNGVVLESKDVPAGAFDGCTSLTKVYCGNTSTALVPNAVGNRAFAGTQVTLDLSATTTIGDEAFANVVTLKGAKYSDANPVIVLKVGAETIGNGAFAHTTALQLIEFANATSIKDSILIGATALEQVKFVKAFTYGGDATVNPNANSFGTASNVDLFVNKEQTGIGSDNKTLTIGAKGKTTDITFKSITKE